MTASDVAGDDEMQNHKIICWSVWCEVPLTPNGGSGASGLLLCAVDRLLVDGAGFQEAPSGGVGVDYM